MPRSSRHKSSKHSSRDARDYSDSEKESFVKERKGKEENNAVGSKDSVSGDKRKHGSKDNKEYYDSLNGEYFDEHSSKRRKEKFEDSVNDRWNGGDYDRGESSKKSKGSSEKSRRRDEGDGDETKRSGSKSEGKHQESSRRETRDSDRGRDRDREKKYKEGKSEKHIDGENRHRSKMISDRTGPGIEDQPRSPDLDNSLKKRSRRKRDDYADVDKHQDSIGNSGDRLLSLKGENVKDGIQKEEKYKNEKYGDKYLEDIDRGNKHRADKQRDERSSTEHAGSRSDEKLLRDNKDASESKRKKSKLQDNDHDHERGLLPDYEFDGERDVYHDKCRDYERDRDHEKEYERGRDRVRDRDRERDRERDRHDYERERDRYRERELDRDSKRDRDGDPLKDRSRDRDKDRGRDYYYDRDRSKSDRDRDYDRDGSYNKSRERKKSPDDYDLDTKSNRTETDDVIRSQLCEPSSLHGGQDEFRQMSEQRTKATSSREMVDMSGGSDRGSKYRSFEKSAKKDDGNLGEPSAERSSSTKASPMRLGERSLSSMSLERRQMSRSTRRGEIEETGHRTNVRDFSASMDRKSRDMPLEKPSDESFQDNPVFPQYPDSRSGVSSPLVGSLEDDNRVNITSRYKRVSDPNYGRGQVNAWRGTTNWPSPVPNGFMPFQHGPPPGGFHPMMPQFPSPSLYGVRPPIEMSHLRPPLGWQNIIDGSVASHMHGWDASNGAFRDNPQMYGGPEWDHNRNRMHGQGWEPGCADPRKIQNGDVNMDVSLSQKDDGEGPEGQATRNSENDWAKSIEARSNIMPPAPESSRSSPKAVVEQASDHPTPQTDDDIEHHLRYYLSKLDISVELAGPELYGECVGLQIKKRNETVDEETALIVNLKDGGQAVPKSSVSLLTPSLLPATNNTLFQRAMELYKKQRVELNGLPEVVEDRFGVLPPSDPDTADVKSIIKKAEDVNAIPTLDAISSDIVPQKTEADITTEDENMMKVEHVTGLALENPTDKLEVAVDTSYTEINVVREDTKSDEIPSDGGPAGDNVPVATDGDNTDKDLQNTDVDDDRETEVGGGEDDDGDGGGGVAVDGGSGKLSGHLISVEDGDDVCSRIHHSPETTL